MSWIKRRPLLAVAALAFGVRAAFAVVTEFKPIFPAYYYVDAEAADADARAGLDAIRDGRPLPLAGALAHRLIVLMTIGVYRAAGPRPLAVKLVNAALGAAGIAALAGAFALVFPASAAYLAGAALALWPSQAFYTSQNLKESPTHALVFAGLAAGLALGLRPENSRPRRAFLAAAVVAALVAAGLLRSYVLICAAGALCAGLALEAARPAARKRALAALAASAAALAAYPLVSRALYASLQRKEEAALLSAPDAARIEPALLPQTIANENHVIVYSPTSPEGLTAFRRTRQENDQIYARRFSGREIGTQIFPGVEFHSWLDVLAYLPKGAFYVLFMPLPGLYPMDRKLGRYAAAAENVALLALASLALAGFLRGPKTPGRAVFILFFAAMAVGSALLEFDLGSAGRHKLLYLPMLFPFAAEEALRLLGRQEPV